MRPTYSMLKFHPPYMIYNNKIVDKFIDGTLIDKAKVPGLMDAIRGDFKYVKDEYGLDMLSEYMEHKYTYSYFPATTIYIQAWGAKPTSEARLIVSKSNIDEPWRQYSSKEWDRRFMYNKRMRGVAYYGTFYECVKGRDDHPWDACYDCMLDMFILGNYLWRNKVNNVDMDAAAIVKRLGTTEGQNKIIELRRRIDAQLVYENFQKCPFHGQVTRVPRIPYMYYTLTDPKIITYYKAWLDDNIVSSKVIGTYNILSGRSKISKEPADYRLASNYNIPNIKRVVATREHLTKWRY